MSGLSHDAAKAACEGDSSLFDLNSYLSGVLIPLCQGGDSISHKLENLEKLWLAVMGYQAPEEEFLAWAAFFQILPCRLAVRVLSSCF